MYYDMYFLVVQEIIYLYIDILYYCLKLATRALLNNFICYDNMLCVIGYES